jgi:hypothetical protein
MGNQGRVRRSEIGDIRYRVWVVARDIGELIDLAGGWICDRILAGWDVCVAVSEPGDLRPLQILGITTFLTDQRFGSMNADGGTASIAITPGIFENNDHIRGEVLHALDRGAIEVTFWGASMPSDLHDQLDRRQHRLSGAARAFKAHALAAAAVSGAAINNTEDLYSSAPWYDESANHDDAHRVADGQRDDRGEGAE